MAPRYLWFVAHHIVDIDSELWLRPQLWVDE